MKTSNLLLATLKETPSDAELISHQLMLRAGLIRKLASGLYTWLPLGLKVLHKVAAIVRQELDQAGAQEILMPIVQPAELWQESERWEQYGPLLLRMEDRHKRWFCFGPTHEEVVTDLFRQEIHSYKQLPLCMYQIQTKFRDEIRPRFGVMRAREFMMKDAYSFHLDATSLQQTYATMFQAYSNIFKRLGLNFCAVLADSGDIGGSVSHEFHVLADSGEDAIAVSSTGGYAANVEHAEAVAPKAETAAPQELAIKETPNIRTVVEQAKFLQIAPQNIVKTLLVRGKNHPAVALLLRGDHTLNPIKAEHIDTIAKPLTFVPEAEVPKISGSAPGSVGPIGLNIPMYVDRAASVLVNFSTGANQDDKHYINANWGRDVQLPEVVDIRNVVAGDPSPDGAGELTIKRGIEVGHIFQLGDKYSAPMQAKVLNQNGQQQHVSMGCYGIGVSRTVAAAIEQNHDARGIIWPAAMAPFQIAIIPINLQKSAAVKAAAEQLYADLQQRGIEVLLDDRSERPGVLFADMDLIGIPHQIIIGEKSLANGEVEYKSRREDYKQTISISNLISFIQTLK